MSILLLRIVNYKTPSASQFLAWSTFSTEKVLHVKNREARTAHVKAGSNLSHIEYVGVSSWKTGTCFAHAQYSQSLCSSLFRINMGLLVEAQTAQVLRFFFCSPFIYFKWKHYWNVNVGFALNSNNDYSYNNYNNDNVFVS